MSEWTAWNGGTYNKGPVSEEEVVEVKFRDGSQDIDRVRYWYWRHDGDSSDIVAYRVVEDV